MESGLQCAVMYEGCDGLSKNVSQVWRGVTGRLGAGEASKTVGLSGFREEKHCRVVVVLVGQVRVGRPGSVGLPNFTCHILQG